MSGEWFVRKLFAARAEMREDDGADGDACVRARRTNEVGAARVKMEGIE